MKLLMHVAPLAESIINLYRLFVWVLQHE